MYDIGIEIGVDMLWCNARGLVSVKLVLQVLRHWSHSSSTSALRARALTVRTHLVVFCSFSSSFTAL